MNSLDGPEIPTESGSFGPSSMSLGPADETSDLNYDRVRFLEKLAPRLSQAGADALLGRIAPLFGEDVIADRFEVRWRAAGLKRPGAIAQLTWPRFSTRVGLGIEPPLAHALVDRLLGFERSAAEGRLQVTPVEWGILSLIAARVLDRLEGAPGPLGPWDLTIDRLGPDPFDPIGLGPVMTWKWRVQVGLVSASARLWLPESLLARWLLDENSPTGDYDRAWTAEVGTITLPRGISRLKVGSLLLIDGAPLTGTPESPEGCIDLAQVESNVRKVFKTRVVPGSFGTRLILESPLNQEPTPTESIAIDITRPDRGKVAEGAATLILEMGWVHLTQSRQNDLKPGDVLELDRQAQASVELSQQGRLIARGDLVQVDTELGIRLTEVFI